tara:strand:+ start:35006 stop:35542 length:537 start_codon:yes stop_codon:yes gene_type:complete
VVIEGFKGLTVIFTGTGKGKTSAALGSVCRAMGWGYRARVIQFIKGSMSTGELGLMERLGSQLEITQVGKGFTWENDTSKYEHQKAAAYGLELAKEALKSDEFKIVVLDEILYALKAGLVCENEIIELIESKPEESHLVLTGRGATDRLIEKADLVTNMTLIKHPAQAGIPAQKYIDY